MRHVKILDNSENGSELVFYLEVNEDDFEERRIEIANGGLLGYANKDIEFNGSHLYKAVLISIEEINQIPKMHGSEITKEEFESVWEQAVLAANSAS